MYSRSRILILISVALLIAISACGRAEQNDTDQEESGITPVSVFENDYAQVMKVTLEPGEQLVSHEAESRLVYPLSDYTLAWTEEGNEAETRMWRRSETHIHEAGFHSAVNTGSTVAEWIAFIRKTDDLPPCEEQSLESDVNLIDSEHTEIKFESDDFRITEVMLPVGEELPMHDGVNRIIYSLSDYTVLYASTVEGTMEKSFTAGDVHWHGGCRHALDNIGDTTAHYLVIAYK